MTYEIQAKHLVEKFLRITQSHSKAQECAKLHIQLCIQEIESDTFINSINKLRLHELKKLKLHL